MSQATYSEKIDIFALPTGRHEYDLNSHEWVRDPVRYHAGEVAKIHGPAHVVVERFGDGGLKLTVQYPDKAGAR